MVGSNVGNVVEGSELGILEGNSVGSWVGNLGENVGLTLGMNVVGDCVGYDSDGDTEG